MSDYQCHLNYTCLMCKFLSVQPKSNPITPEHYHDHPSGIECIQVTEHMDFLIGNAVKYLWRCGKKDAAVQDLEKAKWYIDRKIQQLKETE